MAEVGVEILGDGGRPPSTSRAPGGDIGGAMGGLVRSPSPFAGDGVRPSGVQIGVELHARSPRTRCTVHAASPEPVGKHLRDDFFVHVTPRRRPRVGALPFRKGEAPRVERGERPYDISWPSCPWTMAMPYGSSP